MLLVGRILLELFIGAGKTVYNRLLGNGSTTQKLRREELLAIAVCNVFQED